MPPKQTAKYSTAVALAKQLKIRELEPQEKLYSLLNERGYHWDSSSQVWEELDTEGADQPTDLINIRVWASAESVERVATGIAASLQELGLELVEQSPPYPCRPPKQLESRVYLKFRDGSLRN